MRLALNLINLLGSKHDVVSNSLGFVAWHTRDCNTIFNIVLLANSEVFLPNWISVLLQKCWVSAKAVQKLYILATESAEKIFHLAKRNEFWNAEKLLLSSLLLRVPYCYLHYHSDVIYGWFHSFCLLVLEESYLANRKSRSTPGFNFLKRKK